MFIVVCILYFILFKHINVFLCLKNGFRISLEKRLIWIASMELYLIAN